MKFSPLKLSIRQQLLGLFGLMLATGATVLVLDTVNERATVATMSALRDDSLAGLRYVKTISDAYGLDVVDTTFRVRNDLMGWEQGIEVLDRASIRIQDQWELLLKTRLTTVQATLVDDIRQYRETADRAAAKLRAILKSQDLPALGRFADTELYPAIDPVTTRLQFLSELKMITAHANLDADARRTHHISLWRVGLSLFAFTVVVVVGRQILRHIYRGVEKLVQLAHATRGGDYTTPVGKLPRGELGQVAKALVQMRDTLARNEVELRHSEALAQDASRAKSVFLAAMSHEIRTPMIGVTGMLELLAHTELDAEQRRCVDVIDASAQSLLQIIGDILDFSKIEAGRMEIANAATDLRRLIEGTVDNFLGVASSKGLSLSLRVDEGVANAHLVDPLRLRQILSNLVSNALKFTHKGGVKVELEFLMQDETSQTLALRVHDSGIGIGQEQQDKLFTPFAQAEADTASAYGGTGLGLAICLRLAHLLGGELGLRSTLGEGTSVSLVVCLPIATAEAVAAVAPSRAIGMALPQRAAPSIEEAEQERSLILLVDDHPTNREVISRQLAKAGYACVTANDGEQGLQEWRSGRYALVLADIHMPRLDGYGLTAAIRATEQHQGRARTPILALTANVTKGEAERCIAAGMDDFLAKPLSIVQLATRIRKWLPHVAFPATQPGQDVPYGQSAGALSKSPIDLRVLDEIAAGDTQLIASLLNDFIEAARHDLAALDTALANGAREQATREAHRIKGAARLLGADAIAEAAAAIEQRTRNGGEPTPAGRAALHQQICLLEKWIDTRAKGLA